MKKVKKNVKKALKGQKVSIGRENEQITKQISAKLSFFPSSLCHFPFLWIGMYWHLLSDMELF